jgi:uncharacterized protein
MNKNASYSTKSGFEITDVDTAGRKVAMYLARFDNVDSDGDVIRKGAFTKSINEHGVGSSSNRRIAFLRHHDWQQPIGKFLELREDSNGLYGVAEMGRTQIAEDAWKDYEDGIIREHSIGFQYIKDKMKFIEDETLGTKGYFEVKEVKLFEGSAVTFGANSLTNVLSVSKGEERATMLTKLNLTFNDTLKTLLEGRELSEGAFELEMKLKYLNSQLLQLASTESELHSAKSEPLLVAGFDWFNVISKINV